MRVSTFVFADKRHLIPATFNAAIDILEAGAAAVR
jgi:hypothetical protein